MPAVLPGPAPLPIVSAAARPGRRADVDCALRIRKEPAAARERLAQTQDLIADEQRNLRFFIRDATLDPLYAAAGDVSLETRLRLLARRVEDVWGLPVELQLGRLDESDDALAHDICHIVQEALVNAARHAGASIAHVAAGAHDDRVGVVVADNGRGFPFHADCDHDALTALQLGPVMLQQRVDSLGGTLAIHSSPQGARLEIRRPRVRAA